MIQTLEEIFSGRAIRKVDGDLGGAREASEHIDLSRKLDAIDEMVSASRGIVAMLMPRGTDVDAMTEEAKALVRDAQASIDKALALRDALERQRVHVGDQNASAEGIAKSGGLGAIEREFIEKRAAFQDAVAGRLGRLGHAAQARIRMEFAAAEDRWNRARRGLPLR